MASLLSNTLEILLLALHFLCVDVAMVGPLGALWLARRARKQSDPGADVAARWLVRLSWQALVVAILLGLAIGLLLWAGRGSDGRFFAGLMRLPESRLYFSIAELVFYFVLVVPVAVAWERLRRWPLTRAVMLFAASTNLIYHFPGLFVTAAELGAGPAGATQISSSAFRGMMVSPAVLAQVAHHVLSAVAVVGVLVMAYTSNRTNTDEAAPLAVGGARIATIATLLQVPVGLWLLFTLAPTARGAVLGSDMLTTGLFIGAMTGALGLLHYLSSAALGDVGRGQVRGAIALLALVVLLMTGTLHQIREHHAASPASKTTTTFWRMP